MGFCTACGQPEDYAARFCWACGAPAATPAGGGDHDGNRSPDDTPVLGVGYQRAGGLFREFRAARKSGAEDPYDQLYAPRRDGIHGWPVPGAMPARQDPEAHKRRGVGRRKRRAARRHSRARRAAGSHGQSGDAIPDTQPNPASRPDMEPAGPDHHGAREPRSCWRYGTAPWDSGPPQDGASAGGSEALASRGDGLPAGRSEASGDCGNPVGGSGALTNRGDGLPAGRSEASGDRGNPVGGSSAQERRGSAAPTRGSGTLEDGGNAAGAGEAVGDRGNAAGARGAVEDRANPARAGGGLEVSGNRSLIAGSGALQSRGAGALAGRGSALEGPGNATPGGGLAHRHDGVVADSIPLQQYVWMRRSSAAGGSRKGIIFAVLAVVVLVAGTGGTLGYAVYRQHPPVTASAAQRQATHVRSGPSSPRSVSPSAPALGNGMVAVAPAIAGLPAVRPIVSLLTSYFRALNAHDYAAYRSLLDPRFQAAMTPARFGSAYRSTIDSEAMLTGISAADDGRALANVIFTSHQAPTDGPDRTGCTSWTLTLFLDRAGAGYLIGLPPSGYRASHQPC